MGVSSTENLILQLVPPAITGIKHSGEKAQVLMCANTVLRATSPVED